MSLEHKSNWQLRFPAVNKASEIKGTTWNSPGTPALLVTALQELAAGVHAATEAVLEVNEKLARLPEPRK